MGKKERVSLRINGGGGGDDAVSTVMTLEDEGFFGRLFSPGTVDTDISGDDSEFDGSIDSRTCYTDMSGSDMSDTDISSSDENSTSTAMIRFDRELRAKHRGACKNMTVGNTLGVFSLFVML
jgi:hypothetical protein